MSEWRQTHHDTDTFFSSSIAAIQKISLASNNLKGLPDEIGACVTLEELYLSNNAKFSYFPGTAGHLRRLKELSLSKCPALKQLPNTGESPFNSCLICVIIFVSLRSLRVDGPARTGCAGGEEAGV